MAFGGPIAHLGYYQQLLIEQKRWMKASDYADLVALCLFLPGPTSSQVGFAIGYRRGGTLGAFAAWLAFTTPSALLMIGFALGIGAMDNIATAGWVLGLKLVAVAVVAQAIWGMAAKLCPDKTRALIALAAAALVLVLGGAIGQILVILLGAVLGWKLFGGQVKAVDAVADSEKPGPMHRQCLFTFAALLVVLPVVGLLFPGTALALFDAFYRAGSLVFGGGHVVLPLLESYTVGQGFMDRGTFLAGYGAAQALPGPLFAFSAFLGTAAEVTPSGIFTGILALIAIYLPAWLLVLGALPYWDRLRTFTEAQAALMGTNAAVVGLLLAAFYDPVWRAAISGPAQLAFALVAFGLLRFASAPPWALVIGGAIAGACLF